MKWRGADRRSGVKKMIHKWIEQMVDPDEAQPALAVGAIFGLVLGILFEITQPFLIQDSGERLMAYRMCGPLTHMYLEYYRR